MRPATRLLMLMIVGLSVCWPPPAQAQALSGLEYTTFNLSFDLSSVDQIGNDSPDLRFQDVTFGAELPLTPKLGLWAQVSKAANFNRGAAEGMRKLTGSYGGGLSYVLARRGPATLHAMTGLMARLEQVGDGELNPAALRIGTKLGYRVLGDPGDARWFGLFLQGGSDLALKDIRSNTQGDIRKGDTTYYARAGFEFSL